MAVCPTRMAPVGLTLWENAFQMIPDIAFFDTEKYVWQKFWIRKIVKNKIHQKFDKVPVVKEFWIFRRYRQMHL